MIHFRGFFLALVLGTALTGCNTVSKALPSNDGVLLYKLPYDLTYLRALEALDAQPDWELDETEMARGVIEVRNSNYSNLDDADLRKITFLIKRVDRETTSVSIDPKCQRVPDGDKLLAAIGDKLSREIKN